MIKLNYLTIDRLIFESEWKQIDLHGFCDASQHAYGDCLCVRSVGHNKKIKIALLCSEVRVSPLKVQTIALLELCGALLLVKLL